MKISRLLLDGLFLIETEPFVDHRGKFGRLFCSRELGDAGLHMDIVQINQSLTRQKGAVRGMHFQHSPHAEIKVVRCLRGGCFDVAVDMRPDSPTYLQWHGELLTADNGRAMFIDKGFAHGFQTVEPNTELLYFHSDFYKPSAEGGVKHDDPVLGIDWPLPICDVSDRDMNFSLLSQTG